ncbi:AAA domain-containing protein [Streptomyces sp. C8S0]|uniref:AAA domain-containing protein n=1 Tax=Streptomyces sp. C8S0 TaxID=2585716 RepID=UPI0039AF75F5
MRGKPRRPRPAAGDIAIGTAHRSQAHHIRALLARHYPQLHGVTVDTANRLQGCEFRVTIVLHPLSGRGDASAFHLEAGRLCVLTSRHRHACIVVARASIAELLDAHPPTTPHTPEPPPRSPTAGRPTTPSSPTWPTTPFRPGTARPPTRMSSPRHAPAACASACPHPRLRTTPQTIMMRRADQSLWQLSHTLLRHPPGQSSRSGCGRVRRRTHRCAPPPPRQERSGSSACRRCPAALPRRCAGRRASP